MHKYDYIIKASYGNDSVALIQWAYEHGMANVAVLYNDTGWARGDWNDRVARLEDWVRSLSFEPYRTKSEGLEALVRRKKSWPRQGIQFCTAELKMAPTAAWLDEHDPQRSAVIMIGVRRSESANRSKFPEHSVDRDGVKIWAPLVDHDDGARNALLERAGVEPMASRSMECFPCINSNRADILALSQDEARIAEIEAIETSLGFTSKGKPRTMFRPYRYMGATGIREIVSWAKSPRGKFGDPQGEFDLDDGNGSSGCEAGWCGV
jgi:3'-phosphoadenosine 5'-phosphosulfate sulfotransferase (PAPS reductase)/FAD synthetase